eukprot:scaffold87432_cov13-Tisochrysis_lutea.AAC.1
MLHNSGMKIGMAVVLFFVFAGWVVSGWCAFKYGVPGQAGLPAAGRKLACSWGKVAGTLGLQAGCNHARGPHVPTCTLRRCAWELLAMSPTSAVRTLASGRKAQAMKASCSDGPNQRTRTTSASTLAVRV